jgi:hypothetical protein
MQEFSSYYYAKANEIPQINYVDIAYFEATKLDSKSGKHKSTTQTSLKKQALNTTKPLMEKTL